MVLNATIRKQTGTEQKQFVNPPYIQEVPTYSEENIEIDIDEDQLAEMIVEMIRSGKIAIEVRA